MSFEIKKIGQIMTINMTGIKWFIVGVLIMIILIYFMLGFFCLVPFVNCETGKSARVDETINKTAEAVTGDNSITDLTNKNVSCTSFAAFIIKQQLAKKSDQNAAEGLINVCSTRYINEDCQHWLKYGYTTAEDCRKFYLQRK